MYEKRKYGNKIRYRVTDEMTNKQAKKLAIYLRECGYPCQIDTWKGKFAIWADNKYASSYSRTDFKAKPRDRVKVPHAKPKRTSAKKYGTLEGPEHGGWSAIDMSDYNGDTIEAVRGKKGSPVYRVVERGSKRKILKKYEEYINGGYDVAIIKFEKKWALGEKEWSGAAGRRYGTKTPKSRVTTAKPKITMQEVKSTYKPKRAKAEIKVLPSSEFPASPNVIMENREGTSRKMWGWDLWPPSKRGKLHIVDIFWGRIGGNTFRMQTRTFKTKSELEDFLAKKFNEKQAKGYQVAWSKGGAGSWQNR